MASKDSQIYPTGITVTDAELKALNIVRDSFHGDLLPPFLIKEHICYMCNNRNKCNNCDKCDKNQA